MREILHIPKTSSVGVNKKCAAPRTAHHERRAASRVRRTCRHVPLPSEPCVRLSPHTAQANRAGVLLLPLPCQGIFQTFVFSQAEQFGGCHLSRAFPSKLGNALLLRLRRQRPLLVPRGGITGEVFPCCSAYLRYSARRNWHCASISDSGLLLPFQGRLTRLTSAPF